MAVLPACVLLVCYVCTWLQETRGGHGIPRLDFGWSGAPVWVLGMGPRRAASECSELLSLLSSSQVDLSLLAYVAVNYEIALAGSCV